MYQALKEHPMATSAGLTFVAYNLASQNAVNAHGPVAGVTRVRDRFGNLIYAKPGDYILQDEDGSLRVMPGALFEAEYTAVSTVTAPNTLAVGTETSTTVPITWVNGNASALTEVWVDEVLYSTEAAGATGKTITGLAPATAFDIRVRHLFNERYSDFSATVVGTTEAA